MNRPALILCAALAASGCARNLDGASYDGRGVGEAVATEMGTVRSARPVTVEASEYGGGTGLGSTIGGVAGGLAGSTIGDGSGRFAAAIGGALLGAVLGAAVEQDAARQTATEYVLQLQDGSMVTIVQGGPVIAPGRPVFVQVPTYGRARIVPAA